MAWLCLLLPDIPACHRNAPVLLLPKRSRKTKPSIKVCSSRPCRRAGLRRELGLCLLAPRWARGPGSAVLGPVPGWVVGGLLSAFLRGFLLACGILCF